MTGHRPWRELFEKLPPEDQAEIKANTARVLEERRRERGFGAPAAPGSGEREAATEDARVVEGATARPRG